MARSISDGPVIGTESLDGADTATCPNDEIRRLCPLVSTYAFYIFTYWAIDSSRAQRMALLAWLTLRPYQYTCTRGHLAAPPSHPPASRLYFRAGGPTGP